MKASVDDLIRFGFCPKFYEQQGVIPGSESTEKILLQMVILFVFRKELESGIKVGWKTLLDKWGKFFWELHDQSVVAEQPKYNRSLIGLRHFYDWYVKQDGQILAVNFSLTASLFNHQLTGEIPVIFDNGDETVTVLFIESAQRAGEAKWLPSVRYLSAVLDEKDLSVEKILVVSLNNYRSFTVHTILPDQRFWETAMSDLFGLLQSMQDKVSYSNTLACGFCPLQKTCEAISD